MNLRRNLLGVSMILLVLWLFSLTEASAASCESLRSLTLENSTIILAASVAAGKFVWPGNGGNEQQRALMKQLPPFCRVAARLKPSSDSDIQIEVWMPTSGWNGKFMGVGNGGFRGAINYNAMAQALQRGYATSSTDTGHSSGADDASWDFHTFDLDGDIAKADAIDSEVGHFNAINPDLSPFKQHGCKLIQFHGWNDQEISPQNSINYYETVIALHQSEPGKRFLPTFYGTGHDALPGRLGSYRSVRSHHCFGRVGRER